ncbi:hypothetical protein JCM10213_001081 [Rhodosporidiobolus nylandii]
MEKLPVELLHRIADHLLKDPYPHGQRTVGQTGLSALARTCKAYMVELLPLLYRDVEVGTTRSAADWERCYFAQVSSLEFDEDEENRKVEEYGVRRLSFSEPEEFCCDDDYNDGPHIPDLRPLLSLGAFRHLTSLSFEEFYVNPHVLAALIGPGRALRAQLQSFSATTLALQEYFTSQPAMLFVLEALTFLPASDYTWVTRMPSTWDATSALERPLPPPSSGRLATLQEVEEAGTTFSTFLTFFFEPYKDPALDPSILCPLPSGLRTSPFAALTYLWLQTYSDLEQIILFLSPSFPSLKSLGFFSCVFDIWSSERNLLWRRSITHHPPGKISPPFNSHHFEEGVDPAKYQPNWAPLTSEELAKSPFEPYLGPRLQHLQLDNFRFYFF